MVKKALLAVLVLSGLVFSEMVEECFADASAQLEQAETYQNKGYYQQAEAIYKTVVTDYPGTDYSLEAQKTLAMLYIELGQTIAAQTVTDKLTADFSGNSDLPAALYDIAKRYGGSRKYEEAKSIYQQIIQ